MITSSIPDDFNPRTDIIPGPWILAGQESAWPDWENHDFTLPLQSDDEIAAADETTGRIAVGLTAVFAERLASRHGSDRSPEFWYLLLIRWVLETVQAAWMRYREAELLIAETGHRPLTITAPPVGQSWRFTDIADMYERGICDPSYNAWLLALALTSIRPDKLEWVPAPVAESKPVPAQNPKPTKSAFRKFFSAMKNGRCEVGNMASEYNLPTKALSALYHLGLNIWLELIPAKTTIRAQRAEINPALAEQIGNELYVYLVKVLEKSLLLPFGDRFPEYDRAARRIRTRKGRLSIKTISYQMSADRLFAAAHRVDQGEGLLHLQHGGNYGVCRAYSLGGLVEYNQHAFLTWGWKKHGDFRGNFVPLPAPQLRPWLGTHRTKTDRIVLVSGIVPFLPTRLISNGEFHCHGRRKERVKFITALTPTLRDKLLYRPYPYRTYGAEDAAYFKRRYADVEQIGDQMRFFHEMRRCRLLVLDHPGLTLYQALAAGTPFIGYWTDLQWPMDKTVKPIFDDLRHAGVLFEDAGDAAITLSERWDKTEDWWQHGDVQTAVHKLRDHNALSKRNWLLEWMKAIQAL